jgi:folate-dependent phosphoribosylglycinamide formyltransferase PurN
MSINTKHKISILTGGDLRHQYFIHQLNARFSISEIYIEKNDYPEPKPQSEDESIAWDWFFKRRYQKEKELVLESSLLPKKNSPRIFYLKNEELNSLRTINQIDKTNPGFIAVFGTGILKERFLGRFPSILFNLHIGDPEFYRGSSCNFWPIYHEKLQHISATIHKIDEGIDTGDIFSRQAITISTEDDEQTLLLKPIKLGSHLMVETIQSWQRGTLHSTPQKKIGEIFKKSDFTPKVILEMKKMVESGRLKFCIQAQNSLIANNNKV